MSTDFYSVQSLAARWGVRPKHVCDAIARGHLLAVNMSIGVGAVSTGRRRPTYRIAAAEVARFEQERVVSPPHATQSTGRGKRKFYA